MAQKKEVQTQIVADLYYQWTLDSLVEVTIAAALDFATQPSRYARVASKTAKLLADFRSRIGSEPSWPDAAERSRIYRGIGNASFCGLGGAMRLAAVAMVQNEKALSSVPTRDLFMSSMREFRAYLQEVDGQALTVGYEQTNALFKKSVEVLSDEGLFSEFCVESRGAANEAWAGRLSPDVTRLVERITTQLRPPATGILERDRLNRLARVAETGSRVISAILENEESGDFQERLVEDTHSWVLALRQLMPSVRRAWREPSYRRSLTESELALLPDNPIGVPQLDTIAAEAANLGITDQTFTSGGEICCCDSVVICVSTMNQCVTKFTSSGACCRV